MPRHTSSAKTAAVTITLISLCAFIAGCETPPQPIDGQPRVVQLAANLKTTLTVFKEMVWYGPYPPSRGIRFPPGQYILEAEDAEYWYLRSPEPLQIFVLERREIVSKQSVPGGIMLAKRFNLVPGAGYIDDQTWGKSAFWKSIVWELGTEFRNMEGKYWTKSF